MHEDLVGYLLGAIDKVSAERIEQRLGTDPALRTELDRIGAALRPLDADAENVDPPAGLAERTIRRVLAQRQTEPWVSAPAGPWRLTDLAVAASILFVISLIILPAINESRRQRSRVECTSNLHAIGVALENYTARHGGYLPFYDTNGPFGIAGIYAPILIDSQFATDRSVFVCPSSGDRVAGVRSLSELRAAQGDIDQLNSMLRSAGGSYGSLLGFTERGVYKSPRGNRQRKQVTLLDRPNRADEGDVGHSNSPNHGGAGQNALYNDGSVKFLRHPEECPGCDNLFMNWGNRVGPGWGENDLVFGPSDSRLNVECEQF